MRSVPARRQKNLSTDIQVAASCKVGPAQWYRQHIIIDVAVVVVVLPPKAQWHRREKKERVAVDCSSLNARNRSFLFL